ncbi:MAG: hypothetical protein RQ998_07495 [Thermus sp.]|nr:hypothetical protein [Thermus sp.]
MDAPFPQEEALEAIFTPKRIRPFTPSQEVLGGIRAEDLWAP